MGPLSWGQLVSGMARGLQRAELLLPVGVPMKKLCPFTDGKASVLCRSYSMIQTITRERGGRPAARKLQSPSTQSRHGPPEKAPENSWFRLIVRLLRISSVHSISQLGF